MRTFLVLAIMIVPFAVMIWRSRNLCIDEERDWYHNFVCDGSGIDRNCTCHRKDEI